MLTAVSYYTFEGLIPVVHPTVSIRPSAVLIGGVIVGTGVYIGPLASLRGDYERLIVQAGTSIQDGCIMRGYCDIDTIVRENDHIGHGVIPHGCVIGRDTLVGMNSAITDDVVIGGEDIVAAMGFVKAGLRDKKRQSLMGMPTRAVRSVNNDELHWRWLSTEGYQDFIRCYHAALYETQPLRRMEENRPRLQGMAGVILKR